MARSGHCQILSMMYDPLLCAAGKAAPACFEGERVTPLEERTVPSTRPSTQPVRKVSNDVIFLLGAGVDKALGLPLVNGLFKELSDFVRGSGQQINKALRKHVKHLRFDLQTYDGYEAENLPQKLLGSHPQLLPL